jgi:hypothetical protein
MAPMIPRAGPREVVAFTKRFRLSRRTQPDAGLPVRTRGATLTGRMFFLLWITCELAWRVQADRPAVAPGAQRVRSDSAAVSALLDSGSRGSSTFSQLVLAIEGTDGVVYVRAGKCPGYRVRGCLLHQMSATVERRYLWIALDVTGPPIDVIVTIAHELRHALEILSDRSIRTGRGIFAFYHPNGSPTRSSETSAALATGSAVRRELTQR